MDLDDLDNCDWIPEQDKARLKKLMKEWTGPGKGFVLIAVPPSPERDGFFLFQSCVDARPKTSH